MLQVTVKLVAAFSVIFSFCLAKQSSAQSVQQSTSPSTNTARLHGQELVEATCAACHSTNGNASADSQYPKIAGQKYYYLLAQLRAFKSGARKSDVMSTVVSGLSNAQFAELAGYYSRQPIKPDSITDRSLANLGARIFSYPGPGTPPCAACHSPRGYGPMMGRGGMMGGGMMGQMGITRYAVSAPNLFGQHATYIVQQLDAFASGKRRGMVMGPIAAGLPRQHRRAVAEYLSDLR